MLRKKNMASLEEEDNLRKELMELRAQGGSSSYIRKGASNKSINRLSSYLGKVPSQKNLNSYQKKYTMTGMANSMDISGTASNTVTSTHKSQMISKRRGTEKQIIESPHSGSGRANSLIEDL